MSSLLRVLSKSLARTSPARSVVARPNMPAISRWLSSDSITYSGGQAQKGQGGFYGSGGARVLTADEVSEQTQQDDRTKMLALAHDVDMIRETMEELETFERLLEGEDPVSNKSIEIKNSIKKLMTSPEVTESLNNLEINGEPVWGLSTSEREMIMLAREKIAEC